MLMLVCIFTCGHKNAIIQWFSTRGLLPLGGYISDILHSWYLFTLRFMSAATFQLQSSKNIMLGLGITTTRGTVLKGSSVGKGENLCCSACVEVRGQPGRVSSPLLPCGSLQVCRSAFTHWAISLARSHFYLIKFPFLFYSSTSFFFLSLNSHGLFLF